MKITKITPIGFCCGVENAYNKTLQIINSNKTKQIFLIGQIVHNKELNDQLIKNKNVTILDNNLNRLEMVQSLKPSSTNDIVIFSAHGSDHESILLATKKGYKVYDLTCNFVLKTMSDIKTKILDGYKIVFIGKKNHPETLAVKSIDKSILVVETSKDIANIKQDKYYVTCQTTFKQHLFEQLIKDLKRKIKNATVVNGICLSSINRQNAVSKIKKNTDLVIVISDKKSHNGLSLYEECRSKFKNTLLIEPNQKINKNIFLNIKNCAVLSSSSISTNQIDKIVNEINF